MVEPALVIDPRWRCAPLVCADGTTRDRRRAGREDQSAPTRRSPRTTPSAWSVSIPRRHRSRATVSAHRALNAGFARLASTWSRRAINTSWACRQSASVAREACSANRTKVNPGAAPPRPRLARTFPVDLAAQQGPPDPLPRAHQIHCNSRAVAHQITQLNVNINPDTRGVPTTIDTEGADSPERLNLKRWQVPLGRGREGDRGPRARTRGSAYRQAVAWRGPYGVVVRLPLHLIEFPDDDAHRARRFWTGVPGFELVDRGPAARATAGRPRAATPRSACTGGTKDPATRIRCRASRWTMSRRRCSACACASSVARCSIRALAGRSAEIRRAVHSGSRRSTLRHGRE